MNTSEPGQPEYSNLDARTGRVGRRRDKIRAEIERNRQGGHRVPTWAMAAVLLLILAGWAVLIMTK